MGRKERISFTGIQEEDLNLMGITIEEWNTMNLIKLTRKYAAAKSKAESLKHPADLIERSVMDINSVYDNMKTVLRNARKEIKIEVEPEPGILSFDKMMPSVNLPKGMERPTQIRTINLPIPAKFMKQGTIIDPSKIGLPLNKSELIIPSEKAKGNVLIYTDTNYIAVINI